jgi:hypothetical protein
MSPDTSTRPPYEAAGDTAGDAATRETAPRHADVGHRSQAPAGARKIRAEVVAVSERHERGRRRFSSPTARRLGSVEYTLLALIAFGVAITAVMAIVNP